MVQVFCVATIYQGHTLFSFNFAKPEVKTPFHPIIITKIYYGEEGTRRIEESALLPLLVILNVQLKVFEDLNCRGRIGKMNELSHDVGVASASE